MNEDLRAATILWGFLGLVSVISFIVGYVFSVDVLTIFGSFGIPSVIFRWFKDWEKYKK